MHVTHTLRLPDNGRVCVDCDCDRVGSQTRRVAVACNALD